MPFDARLKVNLLVIVPLFSHLSSGKRILGSCASTSELANLFRMT